jgi:hypothetical protein
MPIPGSVLNNLLPFGLDAVGNLYPSVAVLRPLSITVDTTGQELHTFADSAVVGQFGLACRKSPLVLLRPQNEENREANIQRFIANWQLNFKSHITVPVETLATWQVKVDGVVYQIRGVEEDGSDITTRLLVSIINPSVP